MFMKRFGVWVACALVAQTVAFAVMYRDLLQLRRPAGQLASDPAAFRTNAESALAREALTRPYLEKIAAVAARTGDHDLELRALDRLRALHPLEEATALRLADARRRAGLLSGAEVLYRELLDRTAAREARR
jgi:hypothetical protein